jgi:uncharacterized protein YutE (UPF0331/DUF86 family)
MEKKQLTALEASIRDQQKLIEKLYRKIGQRKKGYTKDPQALESLAYQMHNLYCAFEDLFRLVADHFENHVVEQMAWHKELLNKMKVKINGIRPALISESSYELLNELRGFRHVFRHAYGFELEPAKLKIVLRKALALKKIYKKDIANFLRQLKPRKKR